MSGKKTGIKATAGMTLGALGVVYGDIGTSPIYAFNETTRVSATDTGSILGVLSLIFWTLVLVVSVKYLVFVVRADNKGEGGVLALFSLLPERIKTASKGKYSLVVFLIFVAAAFLFADGLLTPAISVVSAIEGLKTINSGFELFVVPVSLVILGALFAVQFKGTHKIGKIFGPVMLLWFATIGSLGFIQASKVPEVFQALKPMYAINYIGQVNWHIFVILSCVILSATGAEALYADLGHFGKRPIRIGWFGIAGLSLVLCYFGQASLIISNPKYLGNSFFGLAGDGVGSILLVILATLATVIASQALISGVASIASQAIQMTFLPRMKVNHTNKGHQGQIYVPFINALLATGSIALVLIFESSSALAGAYTFAIAGTMLITTICIYWVAKETWKMNKFLLFPILGFFMVVDLAFLASTSTKIMTGAWLPLTIGITLAFMMWIWRKGRNHLGSEMTKIAFTVDALNEYRNNPAITIDNSVGIYLSSQEGSLPQALHEQIRLMRHMPEKIVIVTVTPIDYPYALHKPKYEQINDYLIQVTVENGFMENRNIPLALKSDNLAHLFDEESAVYFLVDRTLQRNREIGLNASEELVYIALHRNAAKASQFFNLPADRVMTFDVKMDM